MSTPGTRDDFTIMRLRVKGSELDPLAVRPRVQNLISEVRLYPLLPESASLFIRKLDDPSPGLLELEAIDSRATQTWRRSFHSRFAQLATSAVRPALGPVSSSAESVVFLDYSELLACLTADWCNGFVGARWWWHTFLKRGDIERVIKQFWKEKIEYVPAALQQLAKKRVLVEFVASLSDSETRELVVRIADRFALPAIRRVVESFEQELVETRDDFSVASESVLVKEAQVRSVAPWRFVVPEADTPRLRPVHQLFLGVALMIRRAPAQVRARSFAREVERWQTVVSPTFSAVVDEEVPRAVEVVEESEEQLLPIEVVAEERVNTDETDQERIEVVEMEVAREVSARTEAPRPGAQPRARVVDSPVEARVSGEALVLETPRSTEVIVEDFVEELEESLTIETELGGFFYLINLAIFLEIYSDFTNPVETFTDLNIWDFVALVGNELNEHQNEEDPIWSLLANLAGYKDFSRKGAKTQRKTSGSRRSELCVFAPLREKTLIWLSHLLPFLRARLRRALNTPDFATVLCRHRARVTLTATHIDVFFSLSELPIEIRLSGLDRDPGWVPAAGRFIAFHFE